MQRKRVNQMRHVSPWVPRWYRRPLLMWPSHGIESKKRDATYPRNIELPKLKDRLQESGSHTHFVVNWNQWVWWCSFGVQPYLPFLLTTPRTELLFLKLVIILGGFPLDLPIWQKQSTASCFLPIALFSSYSSYHVNRIWKSAYVVHICCIIKLGDHVVNYNPQNTPKNKKISW